MAIDIPPHRDPQPLENQDFEPVTRDSSADDEEETYDGADQVKEDGSEISEGAAASFIGGSSVVSRPRDENDLREEELYNDQVTTSDLEGKKYKNDHKIFTFSLPFGGNPLSLLPSLKNFRSTLPIIGSNSDQEDELTSNLSKEDIKYRLQKQQSISTLEESYLFKDKKGADNTRFRAVKRALTPNIAIEAMQFLSNDDKKHEDPVWDELDGDIVMLGGYRGSILRDARTRKRVWIPIRAGFNIRKINLNIGPSDEDEIKAQKRIIPDGMLTHVGPIDIARKLKAKLSNGKTRVHEFGYDWRLSSDINSNKLYEFLAGLESNKGPNKKGAIVIAHSMGGLITHHCMQRDPSLLRGVIYAGVPSECPNILGPIRYGDSVLFSTKILTAEANFFMRSSFAFLPIDGRCFIDKKTHQKYNLDYFDPEVWCEFNLSPLVSKERKKPKNRRKSLEHASHQKPTNLLNIDMKRSVSVKTHSKSSDEFHATYEESMDYLSRTLKRTKKFLDELEYDPSKKYPPLAIVYGNEVPTVRGARVDGLQEIKDGDYYDFYYGPGDGVVHHKWLMPERRGFPVEAKITSQEGHISLLTDLPAIGEALNAILGAQPTEQLTT